MPSIPTKLQKLVHEAASARTTLHTFAHVAGLLELSSNDETSFKAAERIIRIAKIEQQKQLKRYDRIRAQLEREYGRRG